MKHCHRDKITIYSTRLVKIVCNAHHKQVLPVSSNKEFIMSKSDTIEDVDEEKITTPSSCSSEDEDEANFSNELEKLKDKLDQDDSRSASPAIGSPPTPVKDNVKDCSPKFVKRSTHQTEKTNVLENTNTDDIIKQLVRNQGGAAKQLKPPEPKPGAVCFNYPNTDLTHLDVKEAIDKYLLSQPDIKIVKIEFQPRCKLMLPPDKTETSICRWVITVDSDSGRKRLNNREFSIRDISVVLKNYDELLALEFRQYGRMAQIMNIVKRK